MTTVDHSRAASPVDFDTYGDYGQKFLGQVKGVDGGAFKRPAYPFQGRITADGSSGYRAEPGRYHLYISWACPWAHRTAIVRQLMGLEEIVTLSAVDPVRDGRGWAFRQGSWHSLDPVNGSSSCGTPMKRPSRASKATARCLSSGTARQPRS